MERDLNETELRKVEQWARASDHHRMLQFFETCPRRINVPRPTLLGSNGNWETMVLGETTRNHICRLIGDLDSRYNPRLLMQKIKGGEKRTTPGPNALSYIYKELKKGFAEICLASELGQCSGPISRSHSLQKGAFRGYAKSGHVYEFDPFEVPDDSIRWPTRIGVREATTFSGFCNHHDTSLFSPIENQAFNGSSQQIFLHHYRALAFCYYQRRFRATIFERALVPLQKDSATESFADLESQVLLNRLDIRDVQWYKEKYDRYLVTQDWNQVDSFVLVGDKPPDLFGCEFFAPTKDFKGRFIQESRRAYGVLDTISLTVTASGGKAIVILCADKGSTLFRSLRNSLREWKPSQQTMAVVNRVFCQFENFVIVPAWWDNLREAEKLVLVNVYNSRYYPRKLPMVCDWGLHELNIP